MIRKFFTQRKLLNLAKYSKDQKRYQQNPYNENRYKERKFEIVENEKKVGPVKEGDPKKGTKPKPKLTVRQRSILFFQIKKGIENAYRDKNNPKIEELYEIAKRNRIHLPIDTYILLIQSNMGRMHNAIKIYKHLKKERLKPTEEIIENLLKVISNGEDKQGKYLENAMNIFQEETKKWNLTRTKLMYNLLIKTCSITNDLEKSIQFFEEMKKDNIEPDIYSYSLLLKILAFHGNTEKSFEYFDEMISKKLKPDIYIYNSLLTSCKKGNNDIIFEVYKKMIEKDGIRPSQHTFSILLGSIRSSKNYKKSLNIYKEILAQKVIPDEPLLNNLAVTLSISRNYHESMECLNSLRNRSLIIHKETYDSLFKNFDKKYQKVLNQFKLDEGIQ